MKLCRSPGFNGFRSQRFIFSKILNYTASQQQRPPKKAFVKINCRNKMLLNITGGAVNKVYQGGRIFKF